MSFTVSRRDQTAYRLDDVRSTAFAVVGAVLLGIIALLHLITLGDQFAQAAWLGVLFGVLVAGCALAAGGIAAHHPRGWTLGAAVAAAPFAGFILAATVGLAGVHDSWGEPWGIPALVVEAAFLATVASRPRLSRGAPGGLVGRLLKP